MKQGKPQQVIASRVAIGGASIQHRPLIADTGPPEKVRRPNRLHRPVLTKQNLAGYLHESRSQPFTAEQIAERNAEIERLKMVRRAAKAARRGQ